MSSDWEKVILEDALDELIDYRGKTPKKSDSGIPLITAKIVKNGRIETPAEFISENIYDDWMQRGLPEKGDVVMTTEAPLGEIGQLYSADVALAQRIVTLRGKKGLLNNDYLLYLMQSNFVQHQLEARASGSTVRGIKQSELRKIKLLIPSLDEQKEIANQLKTIDQKIYLNQQTNTTLETMAQAIFKSWFVDFDPVRAKIEAASAGSDPNRAAMAAIAGISSFAKASEDRSSTQDWDEIEAALDQKLARMSESQQQQLNITGQLFPDELMESEIGEVPKEWENGNLGNICNVQGGFAFKSKLFKEQGCPVVKIKNINEDYTVDIKNGQFLSEEDIVEKETYELNDGDYVLAMTGATVGKTGIIVSSSEKVMLNQRVAKFESNQFEGNINWFIHSAFLSTNLKEQIINLARGSAQPNISASGIESAELIIPSKPIIEEFLKIADPLFKKWIDNYKQNETLSSLRDTLLPKLISGDLVLT